MEAEEISFEQEQVEFSPENQVELIAWLKSSIKNEARQAGFLNFIFTNDSNLLSINQNYLDHDTYTDIITFDYCEADTVAGDIYISIDRIRENASNFGVNFKDELHRVMIHGTLHLCGYGDKPGSEKELMTKKEDYYLSLRTF